MLIWGVAAGEVCGIKLSIEDSRVGFGGGTFPDFCCFSEGGLGGANLGQSGSSGIMLGGGVEIGGKALEEVDGGFGGVIGGGFSKVKSSSNAGGCEGGFGGGIEGRLNIAKVGLSRSPMKSGGGRTNCVGGGGGATEGGGGTKMSPSICSDMDITDPLDSRSPPAKQHHTFFTL